MTGAPTPQQISVIVLGERGRLPHVTLLACTVYPDRIEAQAYLVHAPLKRPRTLSRMAHTASGWAVGRNPLKARLPKLMAGLELHTPITLPITRKGL